MPRGTSLSSVAGSAITREIDSKYDVIKEVSDALPSIEYVASEDLDALTAALEEAKDFTGITVVSGSPANWDPITKTLTVPTLQGVKGDTGVAGQAGTDGINGTDGQDGYSPVKGVDYFDGRDGQDGAAGRDGIDGEIGATGLQGPKGDKGDTGERLTVENITENGDGSFIWYFSDETIYTTPVLKGSQGDEGLQGPRGVQGISVHHTKGTNTTDLEGDFHSAGELDTYTFYGDAHETLNLGYFTVQNGRDAYHYALENGYSGTEEDFYGTLASYQEYYDSTVAISDQVTNDKAAIELIFDNFDDRYLGAKATDPALDNDGDVLVPGQIYWNTVDTELKFYNGVVWEAPSAQAATSAANALVSEQAAGSSEIAANSSEQAAALSETNALNSAALAANHKNAAASSEANAAVSETNAGVSESNAAISAAAAAISETNAGVSEVNAGNSESAASASEATALSAAGAAATSAANAATSEAIATAAEIASAASETNANTYKDDAETAALQAAISENNALASKNTTETYKTDVIDATVDFYEKYLGGFAVDPVTDLKGDPLSEGALYFNSVDNQMKVHNGGIWYDAYVNASDAAIRSNNLSDLDDVTAAAVNLNLEPGVDIQAFDSDYSSLKAKLNTIEPNAKDDQVAVEVPYDNAGTTLAAVDVQAALTELDTNKADIGILHSNITLYPTTAVGDFGYNRMVTDIEDADYDTAAVDVPTGTINIEDQFIAGLIADANLFIGNPGILSIPTIGNIAKTAGNNEQYAGFYFKVFKRDIAGVEELIATSTSTGEINPANGSYFQFSATAVLNNGTWIDTDRVVIKYYAELLGNVASEYQFQFGGDNPVRTELPVPVNVIPSDLYWGNMQGNIDDQADLTAKFDAIGTYSEFETSFNLANT